ncbi:MAG: hypothetical protein B7Y66_04595, partial [Sphingobacteriia bacterium 35-36-14]
ISEVSILNLLEKLDSPDKTALAGKLKEASEMEPGFFTPLSLEVLSFYFEDEEIGSDSIQVVTNVLKIKSERPDQIKINLEKALVNSKHIDDLAGLLDLYIDQENLPQFESSLQFILSGLSYFRIFSPKNEQEPSYQNTIALCNRIIHLDRPFFTQIVKERLSHEEKFVRYNILGLLDNLIEVNEEYIRSLFPEILKCLTIEDDGYYDSPDHMVQKIVVDLLKRSPEKTYPVVKQADATLSTAARIKLWEIPGKTVRNDLLTKELSDFMPVWVKDYISVATAKVTPPELKKEMLDDLEQMSGSVPIYFVTYFDELIGHLTILLEEYKQFQFWKEELKTKPQDKLTTFNPLIGKDYFAVSNEEMTRSSDIKHVKETIVHIFRLNEAENLPKLQPIVKSLDSNSQADLKKELLTILGNGIKDPYIFSRFVQDLYSYIIDPHSEEIRVHAMKILDKMIEKYPNVVPQTFYDLIEAFAADPNQLIRKYAIELIKTVAKHIPSQLKDQYISFVIKSFDDQFVIVHKAAVDASEAIFPFATGAQQFLIKHALFNWTLTYYQKNNPDHDFCERTTKRLLRLCVGQTNWITAITKVFVVKFCKDKEQYFSKKFLGVLEEIKETIPDFEGDWLELLLDRLTATHPYFGDMGERDELISTIYQARYDTVHSKIEKLESFLKSRTNQDYTDIASILTLCLHFELYEKASSFAEELLKEISDVVSNQSLREYLLLIRSLALFSLSVLAGNPDITHLKHAQNAATKD